MLHNADSDESFRGKCRDPPLCIIFSNVNRPRIHTYTYFNIFLREIFAHLTIASSIFFNDRFFIINLELIFFSQRCLDINDVDIGFRGNWRIEYFYLLGEIPHVNSSNPISGVLEILARKVVFEYCFLSLYIYSLL